MLRRGRQLRTRLAQPGLGSELAMRVSWNPSGGRMQTSGAGHGGSSGSSGGQPGMPPGPDSVALAPVDGVVPAVTYNDVVEAHNRIQNYVKTTPLDFSYSFSQRFGCDLYLKKEHLSRTGSYKERGALNKLLTLSDAERARGVICSSVGNHAQAVSYHSARLGIDCVILMPEATPFATLSRTHGFGARVVQHGSNLGEAYEKAIEIADSEGRTFVHAFNDRDVIAGHGTVALEILKQNPYLDAIVVPVGGGGLIAGMSVVIKHMKPHVKLFGVESSELPGVIESVNQGEVLTHGIAVETIGEVPFSVVKSRVDDIVAVDEAEVAASILMLLEQEKTVVEGSGAISLAAVANDRLDIKGQEVCCVLTGSNIDMTVLSRIIEKGLIRQGRIARVSLTIDDSPGSLARVLAILAELKANVRHIDHERAFLLSSVRQTKPILTLETRDTAHIQEILDRLKQEDLCANLVSEH